MAERVCKDDVAAVVCKFLCLSVAGFVFGNTGDDDNLFVGEVELFLDFLHRVDEVFVVSGVFIVQTNHTDFEVCRDLKVGVVGSLNIV